VAELKVYQVLSAAHSLWPWCMPTELTYSS